MPYARKHGITVEVCRDSVGVLERWERTGFVGSRMLRSCSDNAKIQPARRHLKAHGAEGDVQLIGIHAGESHRAKGDSARFPLVDMDIDQEGCVAIIEAAGLSVPPKSGCWHCPFMRVAEVIELAQTRPDRVKKIIALEMAANTRRGPDAEIYQWRDKPAKYWAERACAAKSSGPLFQDVLPDEPCICAFA